MNTARLARLRDASEKPMSGWQVAYLADLLSSNPIQPLNENNADSREK